jgi:hypothetical protein
MGSTDRIVKYRQREDGRLGVLIAAVGIVSKSANLLDAISEICIVSVSAYEGVRSTCAFDMRALNGAE